MKAKGHLRGEKSLRSDSVEMLANCLNISPAQLISGPEYLERSTATVFDSILMQIQDLHPQTQILAKEAVSLLQIAFRISEELYGIEMQKTVPENPDDIYRYIPHKIWDPFRRECSYGILGKVRLTDGWTTVAAVSPFSSNINAVTRLAKQCTEQQLSPIHLLDAIQDHLTQETISSE